MMLGDSFKRKNADGDRVEIEGTERQAVLDAINADPKLHLVEGDTDAEALLAGFSSKVDEGKVLQHIWIPHKLSLVQLMFFH